MKNTEKILILIWTGLLFLNGVDYKGGNTFFIVATTILSLYYLIGSFKLFESEMCSPIIPIMAGLSLSTSIITIPFNIYLRNWEWLKILPYINILFTVFLLGLIVYRLIRKAEIEINFKQILLRTSLVLVITSVFLYQPIKNQFFRNVIIFLNAGNEDMISNMRMFDYWQQTEEQLDLGNCEKAIEYSLQSFEEGLKWLWIDGDTLSDEDIKKLWKIQATYTNVYLAYDCKAKKLYNSKDYSEALLYQLKADSFLNINPSAKDSRWRNERADSKNKIGLCYESLNMNDSAAFYYAKAIKYHADSIRELNIRLSTYLFNMSNLLGKGRYWNESNHFAKQSILVLEKDSLSDDKSNNYALSFLQLIYNSLLENRLIEAKDYLSKVEQYLNPKRECKYHLYSSILANKLYLLSQSLFHAKEARDCYIQQFGKQHQNVAESYSMLYDVWISIPNYDSALYSIQKGMEITKSNHGSQSIKFFDYVKKEAYYYYYVGNYDESLNRLLKVQEVYKRELGSDSDKLPEVLVMIGLIKVKQGAFNEAWEYADESLRLSKFHKFFIDSRASGMLNDIAYINYASDQNFVADTFYRKSIELNHKSSIDSSLSLADALNGLGLLAMKKLQHTTADSLFNQSLQLYKHRYLGLHPGIGIVLMNQSELLFKRKMFNDALELLEKALENFTAYHRNQHPTIGDMYSLKASILIKKGELTKAKLLLTKALEIYESNFQLEHIKIRELKNRLEYL